MTAPRQILPGRYYFITRRCTQRLFLLRPDKRTNQIFLFCLAAAARRTGMKPIAWAAMSNHYHAVLFDPDGRLPAFLEHFHKLVARVLNRRWRRWENLWSSDPTCAVHLVEPQDVFEKVVYVLANPVVDHLVDRAADWPGATSLLYMAGRRTLTIERPKEFFRANGRMPERLELCAYAPEGEDPVEWAARVRAAVAAREAAARDERLRDGVPLLGRKAVRRTSAFAKPSTRAPRRTLRPVIACRNRARRTRELEALKLFRERYGRARARFTAGERDVIFPEGSYRWPLLGLARCEPVPSNHVTKQ